MKYLRVAAKTILPTILDWTPLRSRIVFRRTDSSRAISLTFDDGPDPDHTPALLEILAAHQVRATFFLVGGRAATQGGLVRRIADEGHTIGNHSFSHVDCSKLPLAKVLDELSRTDNVFRDAGVIPSPFFRPPWGRLKPHQIWRLLRDGRKLAYWSLASDDHLLDPQGIATRCLQAKQRDILLLHDLNPKTRAMLPGVLKALTASGLTTLPLTDPQWPQQRKQTNDK